MIIKRVLMHEHTSHSVLFRGVAADDDLIHTEVMAEVFIDSEGTQRMELRIRDHAGAQPQDRVIDFTQYGTAWLSVAILAAQALMRAANYTADQEPPGTDTRDAIRKALQGSAYGHRGRDLVLGDPLVDDAQPGAAEEDSDHA